MWTTPHFNWGQAIRGMAWPFWVYHLLSLKKCQKINIFEWHCTTFEVSRKEKQYNAWSYPIFKHKNVWETYVLDNFLLKSGGISYYSGIKKLLILHSTTLNLSRNYFFIFSDESLCNFFTNRSTRQIVIWCYIWQIINIPLNGYVVNEKRK